MSLWSRRAINAFAGEDVAQAVFYPAHDRFLVEREMFVTHYEIAGP